MINIKKVSNKFTLVFIYAIIGILWIMLSDDILLYFVKDIEKLTTYQSYKGLVFILATTTLLYILLLLYEKRISSTLESKGQTEKKFNLLYEDSPNPYQSLDSNGNILAVNKQWLDILGYEEHEVLGHSFSEMLSPQYAIHFKNNFSKFKSNGSIRGVEFEMLHKNGSTIPVLFHGQIAYDLNHTMIQTHCSFEDRSSRHQLEHLNGVLSVIRDVNQLIVREKEVKKMLQESCNILTSNHVYGHAWIMILNDEHQLEHIVGSDTSENFEVFKEKVKNGWTPNCNNKINRKFSYIKNTNQVCTQCPLKDMYSDKGAFNIELKHNNKLYGYLNIAVDKKYFSDDTELSLLDEVAGDIAYALYNIKTENNIIELKELYSNTINSVENLIFVKNTNFKYLACNSSFEKLLGKSKDDIIGKNDYDLFSKEIADSFRKYDEKMLSNRKTKLNYEWLTYPDGKTYYYLTTKSPLIDSTGKIIGLVGNSVDFTEQNHLNELLKNAQKQAKLGSWQQTFGKKLLSCSNELYDIFEYDVKKTMSHKKFIERVHPDDRTKIFIAFEKSIDEHTKYYFEHRLQFLDGRIKYVVERAEHFYDKNSKHIHSIGTVQDISESKESEIQLMASEERFKSLMKQSPATIEIYNREGFLSDMNDAAKEMWNIKEAPLHKFNVFQSDEVQKKGHLKYLNKVYNGEIVNIDAHEFDPSGETELGEGRKRWITSSMYPLIDSNGIVQNIVISHIDITDKQDALKQLKHKKEELESIINNAPNPIMIHNEDGKILMINQAWFDSSGYKEEDIPTVDAWINLGYDVTEDKNSMKKHITSMYELNKRSDISEFTFLNKNRNYITWQSYTAPLGIIEERRTVISTAMDITELKEKEIILIQQSKMAAMGEMLGNIAHQWRQPLSTISTASTGAKLQQEMGCLSDTELNSLLTSINESAQYLSTTIDDFRGFFNPSNNKVREFNISNTFNKTLKLITAQFIAKDIEIIQNIEDFELSSIENELIQVLINILNNSRDALLKIENQKRLIFIDTSKNDTSIVIEIKDNAKGIPKDIIDRIFEPYFTTKDKSQGTGIGLYMSEEIIKNHLKGAVKVENTTYNYEEVEYTGACFTIKLPKLN